jgi:hypothetical protein
MNDELLLKEIFNVSDEIRYVALYRDGELVSAARPGLEDASAAESDRYEELLVNPTLLTLTRQRGRIDCGGCNFVLIRYGNFFQFVTPVRGGHASVCIGPEAPVLSLVEKIYEVLGAEREKDIMS